MSLAGTPGYPAPLMACMVTACTRDRPNAACNAASGKMMGLTGQFGLVTISLATLDGNAEKTSATSPGSSDERTVMPATCAGISPGTTQRTASTYRLPWVRSDPVTEATSNHVWFSSRLTKRWPTAPVAPRTATGILSLIGVHLHWPFSSHRRASFERGGVDHPDGFVPAGSFHYQ